MKRILMILGLSSLGGVGLLGVENAKALLSSARDAAERNLLSVEAKLAYEMKKAESVRQRCIEQLAEGRAALARLDAVMRRQGEKAAELSRRIEADRSMLASHRLALGGMPHERYSVGTSTLTRAEYLREVERAGRKLQFDEEHLRALADNVERVRRDRDSVRELLADREETPRRMALAIENLNCQIEILRARRAAAASQEGLTMSDSAFDEARDLLARIESEVEAEQRKIDLFSESAALPPVSPEEPAVQH